MQPQTSLVANGALQLPRPFAQKLTLRLLGIETSSFLDICLELIYKLVPIIGCFFTLVCLGGHLDDEVGCELRVGSREVMHEAPEGPHVNVGVP